MSPEPTDEQLERLTLTLGLPTLPPNLRPKYWREAMLNLHGLVQRGIKGDDVANQQLELILATFRRPRK